jgi:putative ABC transport system permease protein
MDRLLLAFRLARRELRGGLAGFRIFLACLTLGVGAIAAVQSLSAGIQASLNEDGRAILGGDLAARLLHERASPEQQRWLAAQGDLAVTAEMRAVAHRADDAARSTLVELKAVDGAYPLYGALELTGAGGQAADPGAVFADARSAVAEQTLLDRLGLAVGDEIAVGDATLRIAAVLAKEPDRAGGSGGGFGLGPRLMIPLAALPATALEQPGSLITWSYLVRLPPGASVEAVRAAAKAAFPDARWRLRDHRNASPQLARFIDRLAQFLTLVGLTALLVGGVGVSNAVRGYLDGRRPTIATFKCLGAPGALVFQIYMAQVLVLALAGILLGLALGAATPPIVGHFIRDLLPVATRFGVYPGALATAAAFGLLTAIAFSAWPIGRAEQVSALALFRDVIAPARALPRRGPLLIAAAAAVGLVALVLLTADYLLFSVWFLVGAGGCLLLFRLAAGLVTRVAARLPRARWPEFRLAVANLHRPGNPTAAVVLSLGLGLTVLVAIALVEGDFRREVDQTLPAHAPSFFFVDIQPDQLDALRQAVLGVPGARHLEAVPSLRGRIVAVNGRPAEQAVIRTENSWILNSDRGVTYAATQPPNSTILAGKWWPADYSGPPLLAIYKDVAGLFGIGVGDRMTINILGRDIEATVAVVRELDFKSLNINFTLLFSPGVLEAAPQTWLATVEADPAAEPLIQRRVAEQFRNVTAIRIKEALETVARMLSNIAMAVRLTAAIALLAGTLVLAGAVAADHRRRVYDAVVLKVLGATRATVLRAFLIEYGLLGLVTAAIAGLIGTAIAWTVLTRVMEIPWTFLPSAVLGTALLSTVITLALGFWGTWRALGQPAAPLLRNE